MELGSLVPPEVGFLAVLTPYFSQEVAARAHLLLPRPTALESRGVYTGPDGSAAMEKPPVLRAPQGVKPLPETFRALAKSLQGRTSGKGRN